MADTDLPLAKPSNCKTNVSLACLIYPNKL